ncbi:ABC transporter ATP-binding protein [Bacillus methanolicus]|uniref:Putative ABC transporter ATP-binding protein YthP n=1 Tax=Bacillus methanolicus (strain MGA3 / ATCC 53907) TaxID=796606 RepID=I3ECC6_BACMM|nr:ABC transporter ATP-binding protein [Bacillus methanolicus]AIE61080.1 putative ABC transporter ATP-binding protein YthP [Bacillus methanolicus MGA3]EIJ84147.1 ABC transporter related protein [Bacillus methanolicus MGA3]
MSLLHVDIKKAGYDENKPVICDISFSIDSGELVGLIGPNGAGKSTSIKTILGLMEYVEGKVEFREGIKYSYVPERPIFYDELTLWEHLDFVSAVEKLDDNKFKARATELLELFKLSDHAHKLPVTFSKGMQQKAMLILALIANPSIYIIDEPFIGLDPHAMKLFLTFLERERERGAGILMSTHVLDTAEKICDRFLQVNNGRLTAQGNLTDIRKQCGLPHGSLFDCFHLIAEGSYK